MKEETEIIKTLADIGVEKEKTIEIMRELVFNQDATDTMLQEKLCLIYI